MKLNDYLRNHPAHDWEFVVYTDEGISPQAKYRDGFNQMVQDALDGKIGILLQSPSAVLREIQ